MAFLQSNYCTQWNIYISLSFDGRCGEWASSDQNVDYEVIENDCFENIEIVNMSQWKCALMMTAMVKPSAQIEPFQVSKGNEIYFILFFCNRP